MSFYGCHFSFDGIPCSEYGLMLYEFNGGGEETSVARTSVDIVEDRISRRYTPLHYGTVRNKPLEFTMTFGADMSSIEKDVHLDRCDIDVISGWLTGHDQYKWLEITQPDMETVRYRCIITDLQHLDFGMIPWGMTCTVRCDSPFSYSYPEHFSYAVSSQRNFSFFNKSSCCEFYKPIIELGVTGGSTVEIKNMSDNNRTMRFTDIPGSVSAIRIDNENEIITCLNNNDINLYSCFNFNFFRLVRGENRISVTATSPAMVNIICEFPLSTGG